MTIGQTLIKASRKALEDLAEREFSRQAILAACRAASAQGFMLCEIRPTVPVDVSSTEAVKAVMTELRAEWLEFAWIPRAMPGEPAYKILEIRWEPTKKR